MSDFREIVKFRPFFEVRKISDLQNSDVLYIILKHVIWRIRIYSLFREIFKYRENMSNNMFCEIHKSFLKTVKFEYFVKQIIYFSLQITCFNPIWTGLFSNLNRLGGAKAPPLTWLFQVR